MELFLARDKTGNDLKYFILCSHARNVVDEKEKLCHWRNSRDRDLPTSVKSHVENT